MIYDLQRFRDLRKSDNDFGFSSGFGEEKAASPSEQFGEIMREGPPLGIHVIIWCDSVNNMNRTFDRNALREFELRVLFQMSANDSSTVIDSPAAGKLGENRALFYSEEENRTEKFRPYGLPDDEWIAEVKHKLASRPAPVEPEPEPEPEPVPAASHDNGNGNGDSSRYDEAPPAFPDDEPPPVFNFDIPDEDEDKDAAETEAETRPDNV
jgi:hypothetical protein